MAATSTGAYNVNNLFSVNEEIHRLDLKKEILNG